MSTPQYPNPNYSAPQYPSQVPGGFNSAPPLWAPYYRAPLTEAVRRVFKKYATFSGRTSRAEYWWWALVCGVVGIVLDIFIFAGMVTTAHSYDGSSYTTPMPGPISIIADVILFVLWLAVLVPTLALTVRRLHDVNMSGWMFLIGLIPFIGGLILLVFTLLPSDPQGERFDRPAGPAYGA